MNRWLDLLRASVARLGRHGAALRTWIDRGPGGGLRKALGAESIADLDDDDQDVATGFDTAAWLRGNRRLAAVLLGSLLAVGVLVAGITDQQNARPSANHPKPELPASFAKLTPDNPFEDHARLQEEKLRQKEKQLQELTGRLEHLSLEVEAVRRTAEEAKSNAKEIALAHPAKDEPATSVPGADASTTAATRPGRVDLGGLAKQLTTLSADRARAASASAAEQVRAGVGGDPTTHSPSGTVPSKPGAVSAGPTTGIRPNEPVPAPPAPTPDRFSGGIRFASQDYVAPPAAPMERKGPFVLQAGAFARGRMLFGLDAPTDATHDQAPAIAIEAIDTFRGPNSGSTPLTGCMFLGSARGDFSSARVVVKITTISCTFGEVPLEKEITGIVIGPDDKSGVPGELVDHLLEKASWATLAGVGEGTADAFKQGATTQVVSGVTGSVTSIVDPAKAGQYAAASGAAGAARQIGSVAFDRIEKLAPYVSIQGGETVWIYVLKGTELEGLEDWIAAAPTAPKS